MSILTILDKRGKAVTAKWDKDRTGITPGIETRRENTVESTSIGTYKHESAKTGGVRIHRHACPVHVQFLSAHEYVDYDDSSFSTASSYGYWIRYDAWEETF